MTDSKIESAKKLLANGVSPLWDVAKNLGAYTDGLLPQFSLSILRYSFEEAYFKNS
jgi:hypothetical protein